jgi:hypothetical protein
VRLAVLDRRQHRRAGYALGASPALDDHAKALDAAVGRDVKHPVSYLGAAVAGNVSRDPEAVASDCARPADRLKRAVFIAMADRRAMDSSGRRCD